MSDTHGPGWVAQMLSPKLNVSGVRDFAFSTYPQSVPLYQNPSVQTSEGRVYVSFSAVRKISCDIHM